jgi:hypothetical protein
MLKKRERGDKYEKGLIKRQIFIKILDNPLGIKEADLRDFLLDRYGIREKKGIILHLSDLEKRGCIQKTTQIPGKINIWKPVHMDYRIFARFWFGLSKEEVIPVFLSKYVQDSIIPMIIPYFLKYHAIREDSRQTEERVAAILAREDFMEFIRKGFQVSPSLLSFVYDMESLSGRSVGFHYAVLWEYLTGPHELKSRGGQRFPASSLKEDSRSYSPKALSSIELSAIVMILGGLLLDKMVYPELRERIGDIFNRGRLKGEDGKHFLGPEGLYDYIDHLEAILKPF